MEFTVSADGGTFDYSSLTGKMNFYNAAGEVEPIELPEVDAYQLELEYFLKCCQTGRRPELCPPEESALATKLTKLAEESRRENGRKVEVGF